MLDMIGQATAALEPVPLRWLQRLWGSLYIPKRQDWIVLWPHLMALPERDLRVLDAGCGMGFWALELAARRPGWSVVGLDQVAQCVHEAETARRRLGLSNVTFVQSDFMHFRAAAQFDIVLSIHSAHYLVEAGEGDQLFRRFESWLKPGGRLLLLGPRQEQDIPFVAWLPRPQLRYIYCLDDLARLCQTSQLSIDVLCGCIGKPGTIAKQLDSLAQGPLRRLLLVAGLYPLQCALIALDARLRYDQDWPTFAWLLIARSTIRPP